MGNPKSIGTEEEMTAVKPIRKMLCFNNRSIQLFKFMFYIRGEEGRFSVVWQQYVNPQGRIEGIGSFRQQNRDYIPRPHKKRGTAKKKEE